MKRCEKFVLEVEECITFETSDGATTNIYPTNYTNPVIPEGYKYVCGKWDTGIIIRRCSDGSQFVWIPVGSLDSNGTLDGVSFAEKFGRRNYRNDEFSEAKFHETLSGELAMQVESVKKYGGFYISRYNISKSSTGKPQSLKGFKPWVGIEFENAKLVAATLEYSEAVKSHLTFGAEYDSILEWFVKSKARTFSEIAKDSTNWGNYCDTNNSPQKVVETGSREEWHTNNICDFSGNVDEWTQEQSRGQNRVIRGGASNDSGKFYPVASRRCFHPLNRFCNTGFRSALYIK